MLWYEMIGRDSDVVVSTRVRLARNIEDYPFGNRLEETGAREIINKVSAVFKDDADYKTVDFHALSQIDKNVMCDEHKVSREFAAKKTPTALIENDKEQLYIMLLEEDHIRIQSIKAGFATSAAYESVCLADEKIDRGVKYAYDEKLGYLTHCPTNLGTAMRVSVMMFLPALTYASGIRSLQEQLGKVGLTIRGMYGEGSSADGCLYQISNEITLGLTETEIISKVNGICEKIIEQERKLREKLKNSPDGRFTDKIMRSYGTMLYATLIDTEELYRLYCDVRLGASIGIIEGVTTERLDSMLVCGMSSTLMKEDSEIRTPAQRDAARAKMIKKLLTKN